jgi:nucleotide-binding universal stress UspA family protein
MDGTPRAEYVLPAASALARAHEAQIELVHVVQRPPMPRRTPPSREDLELADQVVERNQAEANQYLDQLRSRLTGNVEVRVLVSDRLTTTLHELVKQEQFDLVLISAPGEAAQTRGLDGDVIISMMAYGTVPLMIMQDSSHSPIVPISTAVASSEPGR